MDRYHWRDGIADKLETICYARLQSLAIYCFEEDRLPRMKQRRASLTIVYYMLDDGFAKRQG